jgi:hypothetical protein
MNQLKLINGLTKKQTGLGDGEGRRKRKGKKGRGREEKRKRGGRKEGEIVDGFTYKIRFSEKNSLRGSYLGGTPQTPATPPIGPAAQSEVSLGPTPPRGAPGSDFDQATLCCNAQASLSWFLNSLQQCLE